MLDVAVMKGDSRLTPAVAPQDADAVGVGEGRGPAARLNACATSMGPMSGNPPGRLTLPSTYTRLPLATLTATVDYRVRHEFADAGFERGGQVGDGMACGRQIPGQGERDAAVRANHHLALKVSLLPNGNHQDVAGVQLVAIGRRASAPNDGPTHATTQNANHFNTLHRRFHQLSRAQPAESSSLVAGCESFISIKDISPIFCHRNVSASHLPGRSLCLTKHRLGQPWWDSILRAAAIRKAGPTPRAATPANPEAVPRSPLGA
jgi:hypothetical protein